jgi:SAM-dependent methyltransferase
MSGNEIDWNAAWKRAREERPLRRDASFWNKRAPSFSKHVTGSDYEKSFLDLMQPQPSWSVLDIGCGPGTLAVPLAGRIAKVTALDFSPGMLELLRQRCQDGGITNITAINGSWEDDWEALGIDTHDVVIASRSTVVEDLREALVKLDQAARQRVFISAMVGDGPHDRRIYDAVGRQLKTGPDYIYAYNLLHQMGIYANVSFISTGEWRSYENIDEAIDEMRWMPDDLTSEELNRLNNYLVAEMVPHEGRWRLPAPKVVCWAVISWEKAV